MRRLTRFHPPSTIMLRPLQYAPAGLASMSTGPAISSHLPARLEMSASGSHGKSRAPLRRYLPVVNLGLHRRPQASGGSCWVDGETRREQARCDRIDSDAEWLECSGHKLSEVTLCRYVRDSFDPSTHQLPWIARRSIRSRP